MWPQDMKLMFDMLKPLNQTVYGENAYPFMYHEISWAPGEVQPEQYTHLGRPIEFRYMKNLVRIIKNGKLKDLRHFGHFTGFLPDADAVAIVDNHDDQRGNNGNFESVIMFRQRRKHTMITAYMLAWPYGIPKVMSSFDWKENIQVVDRSNGRRADVNNWMGPPSYPNGTTRNIVPTEDGLSCKEEWVCEHRWRAIANMVQFRNVVGEKSRVVHWWDNWDNQIAFTREGRGFFAMNNQWGRDLKQRVSTDLPNGTYCDVITGELKDGRCTGKTVTVADNQVDVEIKWSKTDERILAIHIGAKLN
jgi:alpha-amylase